MNSPSMTTISSRDKERDSQGELQPDSLTSSFSSRRIRKGGFAYDVPTLTSSATRNENGIEALSYEDTTAGKPPIPVIKAPPRLPPTETHPALRRTSLSAEEEKKRDSGLTTTTRSDPRSNSLAGSTLQDKERELGIVIDFDANSALANTVSLAPPMSAGDEGLRKSETKSSGIGSRWRKSSNKKRKSEAEDFTPLSTQIPTHSLIDDETLESIQFSKRGSLMLLGDRVRFGHARPYATRRQPSFSMLTSPAMKILPEDVEKESQKVRSMYEQGNNVAWEDGQYSSLAQNMAGLTTEPGKFGFLAPPPGIPFNRPGSTLSVRNEHELAGGIEDWEDIDGNEVDRYGFIDTSQRSSRPGTPEPRIQRVSTMLQLASNAPRVKRKWGRATTSSAASQGSSQKKTPSRKVSARSVTSQGSDSSQRSAGGRIKAASKRLPGNKDWKLIQTAGDMLTLPPGLADIAEDEEGGRAANAQKLKEIERGEKWRKMAKVVKYGAAGQGMQFEFDPKNPKVIERTWKGIPDRWRSAVWYSFLATSAAKRQDTIPDQHLINAFHRFQVESSREDVQIDVDVPRTINAHIMFRKRYTGGQRLLFRVLHAFSLQFPEPGYVQGMAALAATLLCYYDEEMAFIMMVRIWTLRGMDKVYSDDFRGLRAALDEFEKDWQSNSGSGIAKKLADLGINPTDWGVRWYLTIFNYSIPFAAQLRIWDVFMLLGEIDPTQPYTEHRPFQGSIDILHATSAALMDAVREILMDEESDFETAMKVIMSWIPIKDEELLMKVVRAEYKLHKKSDWTPAPPALAETATLPAML
ncbi:RabGAP/TBC [Mollisia scopiformis]|uniref:RabGAP/TBC n=1 Tax=Mollisia scopiformis TaxID=149040 RepID=A0A194X617_MOLSC|nr:RabGAP/TBC [Mollisia scopiformis]KUJ15509.1 RabGAP/TBC [Mollisia scopiformis]